MKHHGERWVNTSNERSVCICCEREALGLFLRFVCFHLRKLEARRATEKKPVIHEICIAPLGAAYYSRDFQEVRLFPCTTRVCLLRSSVYSTTGWKIVRNDQRFLCSFLHAFLRVSESSIKIRKIINSDLTDGRTYRITSGDFGGNFPNSAEVIRPTITRGYVNRKCKPEC